MNLISKDLCEKTRGEKSCVSVVKVEVGRDVTGGLGSKAKKWKLVMVGT